MVFVPIITSVKYFNGKRTIQKEDATLRVRFLPSILAWLLGFTLNSKKNPFSLTLLRFSRFLDYIYNKKRKFSELNLLDFLMYLMFDVNAVFVGITKQKLYFSLLGFNIRFNRLCLSSSIDS